MKKLSHYSNLVAGWANGIPDIHRAWIFGSYSTGKARLKSDLDIAIQIAPYALLKIDINIFWYRNHSRLQSSLQSLVGSVPVHLEMYHRYHGSIAYSAINSSGIKPVYKRLRSTA